MIGCTSLNLFVLNLGGLLSIASQILLGTLEYVSFPNDARVDTGVVSGDEVSVHYDPMIAKVSFRAPV